MKLPSMAAALLLVRGGVAESLDKCKPIGWATRVGRTAEPFDVTGGGNTTPIVVTDFDTLRKYAYDSLPRVLHISGTLGIGWKGSVGDRLDVKSNKTIVGIAPGTNLRAVIRIHGASNIILRNIVIDGPGSTPDVSWANLYIDYNSTNIWVDHCEFRDGANRNVTVAKGSDNLTFTWNVFGYTKRSSYNVSNLIATSDNEPGSIGKFNTTFMFNWWKSATGRQPRTRYGNVHVVNNLFTADTALVDTSVATGVTNGLNSLVRTENNHFIGIVRPIHTDMTAGASAQETIGNLFENCTGNQVGNGASFTPPYEYQSILVDASKVEALVRKHAGATLDSPTSCMPIPTSSPRLRATPGTRGRIAQAGRNLIIEGWEGIPVEITVRSLSGRIHLRKVVCSASADRSIDLSSLLLAPGLHLASARNAGAASAPVTILIDRGARTEP